MEDMKLKLIDEILLAYIDCMIIMLSIISFIFIVDIIIFIGRKIKEYPENDTLSVADQVCQKMASYLGLILFLSIVASLAFYIGYVVVLDALLA
jgi:hypothetical protein